MDPRSVERAYAGVRVAPSTLLRVAQAAAQLGYPLPPGGEALLPKPKRAA